MEILKIPEFFWYPLIFFFFKCKQRAHVHNWNRRWARSLVSYRVSQKTVTNSISSLWIILWFSIVIPTEKAVIWKSFVCYFYILFVYVLTATGCTDTSFQSFTLFIKSTLADIIILWLLKLGITMLIHNKDDIKFVTEFPCFLGHPV